MGLWAGWLQFFVMAEVAMELFQDTPSVFLQELRRGRYPRAFSSSESIAATISHLGLPLEDTSRGITLLPPKTVEELLSDRRRVGPAELPQIGFEMIIRALQDW